MKPRDDTVVVKPKNGGGSATQRPLRVHAVRVQTRKALRWEFLRRRGTRKPNIFISFSADDLAPLAEFGGEEKGNVRLLVLDHALSQPRREYLETLFRTVIAPSQSVQLLDRAELAEVLSSEHRSDLFIGGTVNRADHVVVLYRGSLERLAVPLAWFVRERKEEQPDFTHFGVTDFGQTVCFGRFEVSSDAILYAFDDDYRRRAKRRQNEMDDSFGAALRRLRIFKGSARTDFQPISAKSIARIERGEVARPRDATLRLIAKKLGVAPHTIATY